MVRRVIDVIRPPWNIGDLVLNVWNCRIKLLRVVHADTGYAFMDVLSPVAYDRNDVQEWLHQALEGAGGFINQSGQYPLVVPVPEWLESEIALAALSR